jgi:XTP/dITP diphosphohydrolase
MAEPTEPILSLVVATGNRHKLAEIRSILRALPIEVLGVGDVMTPPEIDEDGATFVANAAKKARTIAASARLLTLADDSGLEVDALGGRPGVRSARYAHEGASDAENNAKLLVELADVQAPQRTARFRCALVLVDPWGKGLASEYVVEGTCEGRIAMAASGGGGFGYDPLFLVDDLPSGPAARTMADLSEAEKNRVSHRGRALEALRPVLGRILADRAATAAAVLDSSRQPV